MAGLQQPVAGAKVRAGRADVVGRPGQRAQAHLLADPLGVFLDHHRVRPTGKGRAGEYAHGLAGPHHAVEPASGGAFADDPQVGGGGLGVGAAHGPSVHDRGGERRLVARGDDRLRQDPAGAWVERRGLGGQGGHALEHARTRLVDGQELHSPERRKSPEAPPVFSMRRTASMVMALSAALSMS